MPLPLTLATLISLNDRCLKRLKTQFGNLQFDITGLGLQPAVIAAGPRILRARRTLIAGSPTNPISISVKH